MAYSLYHTRTNSILATTIAKGPISTFIVLRIKDYISRKVRVCVCDEGSVIQVIVVTRVGAMYLICIN